MYMYVLEKHALHMHIDCADTNVPQIVTCMYMYLYAIHYILLLCHILQILRQVNTGDVVLTQIVLSYSGRMMFVGTSSGAVRAVKFPLTDPGEWQEHQVHSAAVSRVSLCGCCTPQCQLS